MRNLKVSNIGKTARRRLVHHKAGVVMGSTSHGIFLCLDERDLVFISYESFPGPLTLNLAPGSCSLPDCRTGDTAAVETGCLRLGSRIAVLDFRNASIWNAPGTPADLMPVENRIAFLETVVLQVLSAGAGRGLSGLLMSFPELQTVLKKEIEVHSFSGQLARLRRALETGDFDAASTAAEAFLGLGGGLTPSGDDLLLGLLLAVNRWGGRMDFDFDIQEFNRAVLDMAWQKTTTLSSNLLDCAANGQADERLVSSLDSLFTGQLKPEVCAAQLLTWGGSSGCDAFVGMALAVLVLKSFHERSSYAS